MSQIQLASWNIRKCVGLDRKRDPMRVVHGINNLGADVVALQEADRRLGRRPAALPAWMVEAETDLVPLRSSKSEVSLGWHGNAILLGRDVEVDDIHTMDLPGLEPRGAVIADLEVRGRDLRIVAVHLGLLTRSRRLQYDALSAKLGTLKSRPTIVMGDFNEWNRGAGLTGLHGFQIHAPGATFHAARPVAALDRIALDKDVKLKDAAVVETSLTKVASDHLPITAKVEV